MIIQKNDWWQWHDCVNKEKRTDICNFIEENHEQTESMNSYISSLKLTRPVKLISFKKLKELTIINDLITEIYHTQKLEFGFDVFPILDNKYMNYNVYDNDIEAKYDWHRDVSNEAYVDMKCTVLINISTESYEGGQFELFNGEHTLKLLTHPGDMLMFQSNQYHRVTPVTKGTRKSLALFLEGPKFR